MSEIKIAMIGLDTSHSVELSKRIQAPDCPEKDRVKGMKVDCCYRFPSPFQTEEGQDKRQKQLEAWGIKVTRNFEEAVADCDALMLEINEPSFHLEYMKKCAGLGKPIFLDKPLADTYDNGKAILEIVKQKNLKFFSSSSLRYSESLIDACNQMPNPLYAYVSGAIGKALSGSSYIWYGVHVFEMLHRAMGGEALSVHTHEDSSGAVAIVEFPNDRRGVVEMTNDAWHYCGNLRNKEKSVLFSCADATFTYVDILMKIYDFFSGKPAPFSADVSLSVMALIEAADRSARSGKKELVRRD